MYIYTFWSYGSHRDRAIKYLNFEPIVPADVHFFLTPLPHSCGRLLWMNSNYWDSVREWDPVVVVRTQSIPGRLLHMVHTYFRMKIYLIPEIWRRQKCSRWRYFSKENMNFWVPLPNKITPRSTDIKFNMRSYFNPEHSYVRSGSN